MNRYDVWPTKAGTFRVVDTRSGMPWPVPVGQPYPTKTRAEQLANELNGRLGKATL